MLKIKIKDQQALDELRSMFGLNRFAKLQKILSYSLSSFQIKTEDKIIEFEIFLTALSRSYRTNLTHFATSIGKRLGLKAVGKKSKDGKFAKLKFAPNFFPYEFAKRITYELRKSDVGSVKVSKEEVPPAYLKQPHHFCNRLAKRLGEPIKFIDLVEDVVFQKTKKEIYDKSKIKMAIQKAIKQAETTDARHLNEIGSCSRLT